MSNPASQCSGRMNNQMRMDLRLNQQHPPPGLRLNSEFHWQKNSNSQKSLWKQCYITGHFYKKAQTIALSYIYYLRDIAIVFSLSTDNVQVSRRTSYLQMHFFDKKSRYSVVVLQEPLLCWGTGGVMGLDSSTHCLCACDRSISGEYYFITCSSAAFVCLSAALALFSSLASIP